MDQSYFKYKDISHQRFVIMCILFVLLLLAVFVIINLYLKNRELKRDLVDFDYDSGEKDDDEDSLYDEEQADSEYDDLNQDDDELEEINENEINVNDNLNYTQKDDMDDLIKEQYSIHVSPDMFEEDDKTQETEEPETIDSIADYSDAPDVSQAAETTAPKEETGSFRRPEFKMINLSREPEPSGIDDDFEFEFIHFEDN